MERKRAWAQRNPKPYDPVARAQQTQERRAALAAAGAGASERSSIGWDASAPINLLWMTRVAVPFSFAYSKNAVWRSVGAGHVVLRKESRRARSLLAWNLKRAMGDRRVAHNRLWLDILVEKPTQRGDAVNVVDVVCDAVQEATGLDDRWYSVRRLDWVVTKHDPRLFVGIGQETDEDVIVCSYCGNILPLTSFGINKRGPFGRSRTCVECSRAADVLRRERRRERENIA